MKCAIVDLGSNTIRLSLYNTLENGSFETLFSKKYMAGLAGYVSHGIMSNDGINQACAVLLDFKVLLQQLGVNEMHVFATASLRNIKNTEKALETMKNQEQYIPFRSFVDSLKAIDSVGVEKAFSNVQSNYAYNVKKRENYITDSIEKKSTIGRFLCLATLAMTVIFYLVVPMTMYMLNLYSQYNQSLSI